MFLKCRRKVMRRPVCFLFKPNPPPRLLLNSSSTKNHPPLLGFLIFLNLEEANANGTPFTVHEFQEFGTPCVHRNLIFFTLSLGIVISRSRKISRWICISRSYTIPCFSCGTVCLIL